MECFRLLLEHLAWIEHGFLSGIRDPRKAGSLWGMIRGVGGVRKSIHQSWLVKGLGLLCWGFSEFRKRFLGKRPALFKSGQWHFHQDNTPGHNSTLVTDYLTKMGIKTVPQSPNRPDLASCDFCLFPMLRGCRYEKIEEIKEALTKVIDMLTQEDFHWAFWEVVGTVQQVHCNRRRLLRKELEFHVCTINKSAHTKKSLEFFFLILVYIRDSVGRAIWVLTLELFSQVYFEEITILPSYFSLTLVRGGVFVVEWWKRWTAES